MYNCPIMIANYEPLQVSPTRVCGKHTRDSCWIASLRRPTEKAYFPQSCWKFTRLNWTDMRSAERPARKAARKRLKTKERL